MATEPLAQPTPADIRPQANDAQHHLGDQVMALGDKLLGLARGVTGALHGGSGAAFTVQGVLRLAETSVVAGIKNAFDVRGHVRRHPWLAVGCAAALGFFCAGMLRRN